MKKLIFGLVFSLFSFVGFSQVVDFTGADTVTNAGADTLDLTSKGSYANLAIQVYIDSVSGTPDGSAKLYSSLDGVNFVQVGSDSLAIADVANQSYFWNIAPSKFLYYRIIVQGSGTMVVVPSAKALGRD